MNLHLYIFCYNEEAILPYVLDHYKWVDSITFIDGQSTDNSHNIINSYPNTNIIQLDSNGQIRDDLHLECRNNIWKECRNNYDLVGVIDCDEFIYGFDKERMKDYNILFCEGYQMVSFDFPAPNIPITNQIRHGIKDSMYTKPCLWNPNVIQEINLSAGGHNCKPIATTQDIKAYRNEDLKLLHYNFIGVRNVIDKQTKNVARKSQEDLERGWGFQHSWSNCKYLTKMFDIYERRRIVI